VIATANAIALEIPLVVFVNEDCKRGFMSLNFIING
jgi:hypothetical protein